MSDLTSHWAGNTGVGVMECEGEDSFNNVLLRFLGRFGVLIMQNLASEIGTLLERGCNTRIAFPNHCVTCSMEWAER